MDVLAQAVRGPIADDQHASVNDATTPLLIIHHVSLTVLFDAPVFTRDLNMLHQS